MMYPSSRETNLTAARTEVPAVGRGKVGRPEGARTRLSKNQAAVLTGQARVGGWDFIVKAGADGSVMWRGQGCALGQLVLAALALQKELVEGGLHRRHRGRQLFQVDEPEAGIVRRRQEHRRRAARAVSAVAPRDAPQIDRVQQERPDVDVPAVGGRGDLPGDHRLGRSGRPPHHGRLSGLDEQGELARAQRVVGGDGLGNGHGHAPAWRKDGAGHPLGVPAVTGNSAALSSSCCEASGRRATRGAGVGPACAVRRRSGRPGLSVRRWRQGERRHLWKLQERWRQGVADAALGLLVASVEFRAELGRPVQILGRGENAEGTAASRQTIWRDGSREWLPFELAPTRAGLAGTVLADRSSVHGIGSDAEDLYS